MTTTTTTAVAGRTLAAPRRRGPRGTRRGDRGTTTTVRLRGRTAPTVLLLLGASYCLVPVVWVVIASTKSRSELFSTFTFAPGTGLLENLEALFAYGGGQYAGWALNSVLYAGAGALLSMIVSTMAGFALAKYRFPGREALFYAILGGVLLPGIALAIPQYLLLSKIGMAGTHWSVLLPSIISPFGIYLARVYAMAAVPDETMEAARLDGASEWQIAWRIKVPLVTPALVLTGLFSLIGTLQVYGEPTTLKPMTSAISWTWVPLMKIYRDAFLRDDLPLAAASSVLLALGTLVLSVVLLRLTQRRALGESS